MKFLSVIILLLCVFTLSADAVIVIKGKERRSTIKLEGRSGIGARVRRYNSTTEIGIRPRKNAQSAKFIFKVLDDDEYTFTLGGGYTRTEGDRKDVFEWIDCTLLRINGKDVIGPKAEKGGKKSETLSRPKALPGTIKLKKKDKLTVEITVRSTPKKEAKKRQAESSMSKRQKERAKRKEAREKARAEEEAREKKEREAIAEANRNIAEKRLGIRRSSKNSAGAPAQKKAEPQNADSGENAPAETGDGE